jgi:hypothetical protein
MENEDTETTVRTVADLVMGLHNPHERTLTDGKVNAPVVVLPEAGGGFRIESVKRFLDEFRDRPERREGTARMGDLASFIAHVNRFATPESAIFASADRQKPGLLAVLDYHHRVNLEDGDDIKVDPDATPSFLKHRTEYLFPISDEWNTWAGANGKPMNQGQFAAFLEDNAQDLLPPPTFAEEKSDSDLDLWRLTELVLGRWASPERMMELSRGLAIFESARIVNATNISTGEGAITFEEEHRDGEGKKLEVPNLFLVGIPVFKNGPRYRVVVRLRYRKDGPAIKWHYDLYKHDKVFDHAFEEACKEASEKTGLPLFVGIPERTGSA